MREKSLPPVYPITDTGITGLSHTEQVRCLVDGGATIIQLREKNMSARSFYEDALDAVKIARASGVTILINDRVDIALAVGADGVHLGQTDLSPNRARLLLGRDRIVGYSTHSVVQAVEGAAMGVDYIAIGPVFETDTKDNPDPIVGLDGVKAVRAAVGELPIVAIGGVRAGNFLDVLSAGADSVAMISGILRSEEGISAAIRGLFDAADTR